MKCRDFHGKIHDIPKEEIRTRASVYGVIFNEDKTKILLVKHFDGFDYPGGGIEVGQNTNEALEREVLEETGYKLKNDSLELLEVETDLFYHNFKKAAFQTILIYYTASLSDFNNKESVQKSASEIQYMGEAKWVAVKDVSSLKFYNPVDNLTLIKQALAKV